MPASPMGTPASSSSSTIEVIATTIPDSTPVLAINNGVTNVGYVDVPAGKWNVTGAVNFACIGASQSMIGFTMVLSNDAVELTSINVTPQTPDSSNQSYYYGSVICPRVYDVSVPTRIYLLARVSFTTGRIEAFGYIQAEKIG